MAFFFAGAATVKRGMDIFAFLLCWCFIYIAPYLSGTRKLIHKDFGFVGSLCFGFGDLWC